MRAWAAVVAVLIGVIVPRGVEAHEGAALQRHDILSKFDMALDIEGVSVDDFSPKVEFLRRAKQKGFYFLSRVASGRDNRELFRLSRTNDRSGAAFPVWKRKAKEGRKGEWQHVCCTTHSNVVGGGQPIVDYVYANFEQIPGYGVLRDNAGELHAEVGAVLKLGDEFLPLCDFLVGKDRLFHSLRADGHGLRYFFHRASCPGCLRNGGLHIRSLVSSYLVHFFDRLFEPTGLDTEDNKLKPSYQSQDPGQAHHPAVGVRLFFAFGLFLGGFFGSLWGWNQFDKKRYVVGATLIGVSLIVAWSGIIIWLCT